MGLIRGATGFPTIRACYEHLGFFGLFHRPPVFSLGFFTVETVFLDLSLLMISMTWVIGITVCNELETMITHYIEFCQIARIYF